MSNQAPQTQKQQISYADCGVDIDAGNAFVGRKKNADRKSTRLNSSH